MALSGGLVQVLITANGNRELLHVQSYLPSVSDCGIGIEEHLSVTNSVSELADPEPSRKKEKTRGKYAEYSDEDRAMIGKYASQNGN